MTELLVKDTLMLKGKLVRGDLKGKYSGASLVLVRVELKGKLVRVDLGYFPPFQILLAWRCLGEIA